jgi:hypothetical protein
MSSLQKSFLLIIVSVCCFGLEANAQLPHFGATVGLNFATVTGSDVSAAFPDKGARTGLVVGAFVTYDFIPFLGIQPEVLYSMKGTKGSAGSLYGLPGYSYTQTFNYIEIPVLLKLNLPLGPVTPLKASVYAGPDFAFNVASNEEFTGQGVPGGSYTIDTKDLTRLFDFNLAVGAGAGFDVGPTTLGLELRYTFGTGQLTKAGEGDFKNGVFAIMASVGI